MKDKYGIKASRASQTDDKINLIINGVANINLAATTKNIQILKGMVVKPNTSVSIDDINATIKTKGANR